jgi:phage tail-like protein
MPSRKTYSARFDPYKNFKFRLRIDGKVVAGISNVSSLKQSTELVTHREGGDSSTARLSPSQTKHEPVTLERGVTHDTEFEKWAMMVWNVGSGSAAKNFRKDVILELYNEAGQLAKAYRIYSCWVSEYQALPELDASANAVAIQHIKLEHEGYEII